MISLLLCILFYMPSQPAITPDYMERVMGIEPTYSAWKAEVLPLNYTRRHKTLSLVSVDRTAPRYWWRGKDSNLRRRSRQIYSLFPLATREPLQKEPCILYKPILPVNKKPSLTRHLASFLRRN